MEKITKLQRAATVAGSIAAAAEAHAIEPEKLHPNASPAEIAQYMHGYSLADGDKHESYAASVRVPGERTWHSAAANGEYKNVGTKATLQVYGKLAPAIQRAREAVTSVPKIIWDFHNHSAELLNERMPWDFFISRSDIVDKNALLSGPSERSDCIQQRGDFTSGLITLNVIIEPGGMWMCSSKAGIKDHHPLWAPEAMREAKRARNDMIRNSQKFKGEALMVKIHDFEARFEKATNVVVRFIPIDATQKELDRVAESILNSSSTVK